MDENTTAAPEQNAGAAATVTVGADHTAENRAAEVAELCATHRISGDRVATFIREGKSRGDVAQIILSEQRQRNDSTAVTPPAPRQAVDLTDRERRRYSVASAIAQEAGLEPRGFEAEVSEALDKNFPSGVDRQGGILIPTFGLAPLAAGQDTGTTGAGAELVFTEEGDFIDRLRNRAMVLQLGATFLPGLVGNYAEPRQTGDATAQWVAENPGSDVTGSELSFDQVKLIPRLLQGNVPFSRLLFRQSRVNIEERVRSSLAAVHARAIDLAALHGTGSSNQPKGLYAARGVNAVAMGGAITFGKVVSMESAILADNADVGTMAYLTTPEVRGVAKQTQKDAGSGLFLWTGSADEGEMNGYRAAATNQVAKTLGAGTNEHGILFGAWSELYIGEWGVLELIVDPYALKKRGMIEVTSFQTADIQLRHEEAFAKGTGLTAA